MRRVLMLFCAVTASLAVSFVAPTSAAGVQVTIEAPVLTSPNTALLKGTVSGRGQVAIDEWLGNRWRVAQSVTADAAGAWQASVPATTTPVYYRARAWTTATDRVLVQATAEPEPDPEPDPDPTPGPSDACGARPKKADGSYWSCTLAEDFAGTELNRSVWMPQTIFKSGTDSTWACYLDDPSVLSVHDDALHLTVRKLDAPMACPGNKNLSTSYVAGMVSTYRLFSQQYGRFEARIKNTATTQPGLQEAFWLWPDDRYSTGYWPAAGEIDISETYSQYPDLAIPFLHYTFNDNGGPQPGLNTAWNCTATRGVYNTFTLEWTANRIEILVNGKSCLVNTSGDPAFQKPYIIALTQMLGTAGNAYDGRAPLPATMTIDYVRVWS
jgi:beta-glucanase (GH16 family)